VFSPGVFCIGVVRAGLVGGPEGVASNGVRGRLDGVTLKPEALEGGRVMLTKLVVGEFSDDGSGVRLLKELGVLELRVAVVDDDLVYLPDESRCLVVVPVLVQSASIAAVFQYPVLPSSCKI
jgi:hypothetical protein